MSDLQFTSYPISMGEVNSDEYYEGTSCSQIVLENVGVLHFIHGWIQQGQVDKVHPHSFASSIF